RRSFLTLLGGASAAAWPLAAGAQQRERMRLIGWLIGGNENDRDRQAHQAALREGLAKLGWIEGRNLRIDIRSRADLDALGANWAELVSREPDVILASGGAAANALQQRTLTIPIVFTGPDPVAAGLVQNIARPEGNITGFPNLEPSLAGKWLELLKE